MDNKENKIMQNFKKEILKNFPDAQILLFGSRAKNNNLESSDFDIIVISDKFKDIKMPRRFELVYPFWNSKYNADIIPYTNIEFEKQSSMITIAKKAKQEGIFI